MNDEQSALPAKPAETPVATHGAEQAVAAPGPSSAMPPPLPPPLPLPAQPAQGFIARHWCGQYSLLRSFWVHHLLAWIVLVLAIGEIETAIFFSIRQPVVLLTFLGLSASVGFLFVIWAAVGVWRAATAYTGRRSWADAAKLTMLLATLYAIYSVLFVSIPQGFGYYNRIVAAASATPPAG